MSHPTYARPSEDITDWNRFKGISMTVVLVAQRLIDLLLHVMLVRLLGTPIIVQIDLHRAEAGLRQRSEKTTRLLKAEP